MKFTAIFAVLSATLVSAKISSRPKSPNNVEGKYISQLMSGAKPTKNSQLGRRLQNNDYEVDISQYSVKFKKCQFVKSYDDDLAADEDMPTVLATKRFIIFRLCPDNDCNNCNYGYGEYLVDLQTYLEATVEYQKEKQQEMCNACQNYCNFDDDANNGDDENANGDGDAQRHLADYAYGVDCTTCYADCMKIQNMENNGYRDATDFLECTLISDAEDDDKDNALYAGPMCASSGFKIKIGVFTDQYCSILDTSKDVEDYMMYEDGSQAKLSHALLKAVYSDSSCVSCAANNNDGNANVNDMCEELYQESAKCEKSHGFDNGYASYNNDYNNQQAQEETVCDFIDSIKAGSYDEYGEIVVTGANLSTSGTTTTSGQKLALSFFILGTVGLAFYAGKLHRGLTKGLGADLSRQGGTLA